MKIDIFPRKQISDRLWNNAVAMSINENVYGYTWYLDIVCDNWLGVVINDYEKVMPLPYFKFLGKKIVYLPDFVPYINLYSTIGFEKNEIQHIIKTLENKIIFSDLKIGRFNFNENFKLDFYNALHIFEGFSELIPFYNAFYNKINHVSYRIYLGISPISIKDFIYTNQLNYSKRKLRILTRLISEIPLKRFGLVFSVYDKSDKLIGFAFFVASRDDVDLILWETVEKKPFPLFFVLKKFILNNKDKLKTLSFFIDENEDFKILKQYLDFKKYGIYTFENKKFSFLLKLQKRLMK